ncbi:hypothetical protein ACIA6C_11185 [Streptomyces sp. NPDC051578]|uniref:hypothetical protein n=1 Tax=Streptomyces sp. NPDC051578 TaxID=3365662 RepID=UPI00378B8549
MDAPTPGAWLRAGIRRDGGPLREDEHVVWLRSGACYADSRGFAGTTSHDGRQVTFHHEIGSPGEDIGTLRPDGSGLVETGTNTDGSTFLEVWTPLGGDRGPEGSWRAGGAQIVRVGRHVVHVDAAGTGAYFELPGSGQD